MGGVSSTWSLESLPPHLGLVRVLRWAGEKRQSSLPWTSGESFCGPDCHPHNLLLCLSLSSGPLGPRCAVYLEQSPAGGREVSPNPTGHKRLPAGWQEWVWGLSRAKTVNCGAVRRAHPVRPAHPARGASPRRFPGRPAASIMHEGLFVILCDICAPRL